MANFATPPVIFTKMGLMRKLKPFRALLGIHMCFDLRLLSCLSQLFSELGGCGPLQGTRPLLASKISTLSYPSFQIGSKPENKVRKSPWNAHNALILSGIKN